MISDGAGFIFAVIAAICNGSFLVPFKSKAVMDLRVDPLVFQIYASMGIFIASWFLVIFLQYNPQFVGGTSTHFAFVPLAVLAGCFVVLSMTFSFFATRKIGVALAQGIFGGLAIIVSYIWGLLLFHEEASNPVLSVFGIILIVIGIAAIGACKELSSILVVKFPNMANWLSPTNSVRSQRVSKALDDSEAWGISPPENTTEMESGVSNNDKQDRLSLVSGDRQQSRHSISSILLPPSVDRSDFIQGCVYAVLCGIFGGSSLVPLYYIPHEHAGFALFPGFGVGAMITAPVVLVGYCLYFRSPFPPIGFNIGMYSGVLAGIIWMGNCVFTIGAIPVLGYSVAFPLVHTSVFISGLWGIYLFGELDGFALSSGVFFAAGAVLIGGAVMISVGK